MDENQPTAPLPDPQQPGAAAATGNPPTPASAPPPAASEPFYKRHGLAFAITTLVLGVIVLFGGAGIGAFAVGSLIGHTGSTLSRMLHDGGYGHHQTQPGLPAPGNPQPGEPQEPEQTPEPGPMQRGIVRGTVSDISGSTWTVETENGASLTVETTSSTGYGIPGQSQNASDFATGDEVIIVGERNGDTITASRILKLSDFPLRPPSSPGTATPAPSTPGS